VIFVEKCRIGCGIDGRERLWKTSLHVKIFAFIRVTIVFLIIYVYLRDYTFLLILGYVIYSKWPGEYRIIKCPKCGKAYLVERKKYNRRGQYIGK